MSEQAQRGQQIQWVELFGRAKLGADEVQIASGGADMAVAQQFLNRKEVYPAFQQVGGKAVAQGVDAAALLM